MIKLTLITILSTFLYSNPLFINGEKIFDQSPLTSKYTAIENGGTMIAIDAYRDSIGAYIVSDKDKINNTSFNNLVINYGEEAKNNNELITEHLSKIKKQFTVERQYLDIKNNNISIICNDNNDTTEDILINNKCVNNRIICEDNNPNTNNLIVNGSCNFPVISCNDNNSNTNDSIDNGICVFKQIECDDGNPNTNDLVDNGICVFTAIKCEDNNPDTVNYLNEGMCYYIKKDCNDNNLNTIDTLKDGKCYHTLIDCDDKNISTTDNGPINGICSHTLYCNDNNTNTIDSIENGSCIHKNISNGSVSLDSISINLKNNAREYSDGTYASSCNEYKFPTNKKYVYKGDIGSGTYLISPYKDSVKKVFCDMDSEGGGWTLITSANNKDSFLRNNIKGVNDLKIAGFKIGQSRDIYPVVPGFTSINIPPGSYVSIQIPNFGKEIKIFLQQSYEKSNSLKTYLYIGSKLVYTTDKNNFNKGYIGLYKNNDFLYINQHFGINTTYLGDIYIR